MDNTAASIEQAADVIRNAEALIITAGAGMGVDSGLPDFRGKEGFWKAYPVIAQLGIDFSDMANPHWFETRPQFAWAFYGHRLHLYRDTTPHAGFAQLLALGQNKPAGYFVFTSNVDGQFQKAGYDPNYIEECHGSIHYLQCINNCSGDIWSANDTNITIDQATFKAQFPLPTCPHCGERARPNILMFGDGHWEHDRSNDQSVRFAQWVRPLRNTRQPVAIIEMGAGKAVPTVRLTSQSLTQRVNGTLIRINPRDYQVPYGHIAIPLGAQEGIERICKLL